MHLLRIAAAVTALGLPAAAVPVPASLGAQGPVRFDAGDPATLADLMRELGYVVDTEFEEDPPALFSVHDGLRFGVWFYDCRGGTRCGAILLEGSFEVEDGLSLRRINEWNRDALMGRAYLDDRDGAVVEHYVVVEGGVTPAAVEAILRRWIDAIGGFSDHLYR